MADLILTDEEFFLHNDRDRCVRHMRSQAARIAELEAALRKVENAAFNDNGDISYNIIDMHKAYFAARAVLGKDCAND